MKSRRSGVHPGGSYGYSMNGPPPTPQQTWRLASSPIPLVHVWGVNQRLRRSASSAIVRAPEIPSASTTSGWTTSSASCSSATAQLVKPLGHLAARDPHARHRAQRPHAGQVRARQRLLDPQHAVLVEPLDHPAGVGDTEAGGDVTRHPPPLVEVDHDLERVVDGLTDRGHDRDALGDPVTGDPHLDGAEPLLDQRPGVAAPDVRRSQLAP